MVPPEMRAEPVWNQHRWADKSDEEWMQICSRLLSPPEKNYAFWDWVEADVLAEYVARGEQVVHAYASHPYLETNVKNASRALEFASTLGSRWTVVPGFSGSMKQAIRTGNVVETHGSLFDESDEFRASLVSANRRALRALRSLDRCKKNKMDEPKP